MKIRTIFLVILLTSTLGCSLFKPRKLYDGVDLPETSVSIINISHPKDWRVDKKNELNNNLGHTYDRYKIELIDEIINNRLAGSSNAVMPGVLSISARYRFTEERCFVASQKIVPGGYDTKYDCKTFSYTTGTCTTKFTSRAGEKIQVEITTVEKGAKTENEIGLWSTSYSSRDLNEEKKCIVDSEQKYTVSGGNSISGAIVDMLFK